MIAIYARQSVDKKDSISIESQIEQCKYEVKKESYAVYEDKGYSGKNIDRPRFKDMMDDIKAGKITKVVCYKLDRISRSLLDFAEIMDVFTEFNVEFVSMNEKFDTSTAMGRAMLNICIVFAQLERETIQMRVIDAYADRSRKGFYMGGRVPYGFKRAPITINGINTSQYEPIPKEVKHLQTIFSMYAKPATTLGDIVRYFKEQGIEKTRGVEWSSSRLTEILRNPIYVKADMNVYNFYTARNTEIANEAGSFIGKNGCYLYTKNTSLIKNKKDMSQYDNMILVLAPHEGIIDSDTWIRCRLKAEQNTQIPNARRAHTTWVSGKLKCCSCGYAMRYNKWTGKTKTNEYYICSEAGRKCTGIGAVKKDFIESVVFEELVAKIKSLKIEQNQSNPNQSEINSIKATIATKEQEIYKLLGNFKEEDSSSTVMEYVNKSVQKLATEIEEHREQIVKLEANKSYRKQIDTKALDNIFKNWHRVSKEDKEKVVDILITKVSVSKDKIEIVWKI